MDVSGALQRCRRSLGSTVTFIKGKKNQPAAMNAAPGRECVSKSGREAIFLFPFVIILYSIVIFILSIYGIATFRKLHSKSSDDVADDDELVFPSNILVCSLILVGSSK